jgi:ABC-2 type transport system ATP-binding protein
MENGIAIQMQKLNKRYGDFNAVQTLDLTIRQGEIFSLLGPNGAGKSTTISMLSCLLPPTSGDAQVMGHSITHDPRQVKQAIGVVPQEIAIYEDLSARDNLFFWGRMAGLKGKTLKQRVDLVLEMVGLTERQNDRTGKFSGGMKRRLNIGIALLHEPRLVIMDEPTVGIDPQSRRKILDGVKELNAQGVTILYTTHYMEEAEELSHRIAIMDGGQVIAQGTRTELIQLVGEQQRVTLTLADIPVAFLEACRLLPGVQSAEACENSLQLMVRESDLVLPSVFEAAARAGTRILSLDIQEPNLEAVFLHLTGKALRD